VLGQHHDHADDSAGRCDGEALGNAICTGAPSTPSLLRFRSSHSTIVCEARIGRALAYQRFGGSIMCDEGISSFIICAALSFLLIPDTVGSVDWAVPSPYSVENAS